MTDPTDPAPIPLEQPSASEPPGPSSGATGVKRSAKATPISSLAILIREAYRRKGRPVSLPPKQHQVVAQALELSPEVRDELRELAHTDTPFAVPRELLLLAHATKSFPRLSGALSRFVQERLEGHPLLAGSVMQATIRNVEGCPAPEESLRMIARAKREDFQRDSVKPVKAAAFARLKLNVANALALWIAQTRSLDNSALAELLCQALWADTSKRKKSEITVRRGLTEASALNGLATSGALLHQRASEAVTRAHQLSDHLAVLQTRLEREAATCTQLRNELDEERRQRIAERSNLEKRLADLHLEADNRAAHARDNYETLRARMLRSVSSDLELLESGLEAARRPVPKPDVLVDAAERVGDSMRRVIRSLKGE